MTNFDQSEFYIHPLPPPAPIPGFFFHCYSPMVFIRVSQMNIYCNKIYFLVQGYFSTTQLMC